MKSVRTKKPRNPLDGLQREAAVREEMDELYSLLRVHEIDQEAANLRRLLSALLPGKECAEIILLSHHGIHVEAGIRPALTVLDEVLARDHIQLLTTRFGCHDSVLNIDFDLHRSPEHDHDLYEGNTAYDAVFFHEDRRTPTFAEAESEVRSLFGPQVAVGPEPRDGLPRRKRDSDLVYYRVRYSEGSPDCPGSDVHTWDRGCTPGKKRGGHYALGIRLYLSDPTADGQRVEDPKVCPSDVFPGPALCQRLASYRQRVIDWIRDQDSSNPDSDNWGPLWNVRNRFGISSETAKKYIALARS